MNRLINKLGFALAMLATALMSSCAPLLLPPGGARIDLYAPRTARVSPVAVAATGLVAGAVVAGAVSSANKQATNSNQSGVDASLLAQYESLLADDYVGEYERLLTSFSSDNEQYIAPETATTYNVEVYYNYSYPWYRPYYHYGWYPYHHHWHHHYHRPVHRPVYRPTPRPTVSTTRKPSTYTVKQNATISSSSSSRTTTTVKSSSSIKSNTVSTPSRSTSTSKSVSTPSSSSSSSSSGSVRSR